jgi:radical SAM superfamily enzyme YgiQ (UPF0313 family)
VVSRGCPHRCDFCYKEAFFRGGKSFYTRAVDEALAEVAALPDRHLYFLDDHLFGDRRFASDLFEGLAGMGRVWQAAGTVQSVLEPGLLEQAVAAGLRSLFVGFETLDPDNLSDSHKFHNVGRDYQEAIRRLHGLGVMVNASFVFGLDRDDETVFDRTVDWAVRQGIETATFHVLTPYPGTALFDRMAAEGRILTTDWDRYDTRHAVFRPARMTPETLERGYWRAYRDFYSWSSISRAALVHDNWTDRLRHLAVTAGWRKAEPLWEALIRAGAVSRMLPVLEGLLGRGRQHDQNAPRYLTGPGSHRIASRSPCRCTLCGGFR